MKSRNKYQKDPSKLSSHDLSRILQISRATISRWIAGGCPFQKEEHSRRYLFNLSDVENWLNRKDKQQTSRGFPSRRRLKQYWIFDWEGRYVDTVSGSQNAYESITWWGRNESYRARACAVDATGNDYIAYGGKLRRYDPYLHKDDIEWDESYVKVSEDDE